jgi:hypothetical protein
MTMQEQDRITIADAAWVQQNILGIFVLTPLCISKGLRFSLAK